MNGNVYVLSCARYSAMVVGDKSAGSGLSPCLKIGLLHANSKGSAVRVATKHHQATHGHIDDVAPVIVAVGACLAKRSNGDKYDPEIDGAEFGVAQTQLIHVIRRERLHYEIGAPD
jgi:hypothetical protein